MTLAKTAHQRRRERQRRRARRRWNLPEQPQPISPATPPAWLRRIMMWFS